MDINEVGTHHIKDIILIRCNHCYKNFMVRILFANGDDIKSQFEYIYETHKSIVKEIIDYIDNKALKGVDLDTILYLTSEASFHLKFDLTHWRDCSTFDIPIKYTTKYKCFHCGKDVDYDYDPKEYIAEEIIDYVNFKTNYLIKILEDFLKFLSDRNNIIYDNIINNIRSWLKIT